MPERACAGVCDSEGGRQGAGLRAPGVHCHGGPAHREGAPHHRAGAPPVRKDLCGGDAPGWGTPPAGRPQGKPG